MAVIDCGDSTYRVDDGPCKYKRKIDAIRADRAAKAKADGSHAENRKRRKLTDDNA